MTDVTAPKTPEDMTDQELEAYHAVIQARRRAREKEADRIRSEERRANNERIEHELDVRYSAQAGVTLDEWLRLKEVWWEWHWEYEKYFC
jgi:hypothetical protein